MLKPLLFYFFCSNKARSISTPKPLQFHTFRVLHIIILLTLVFQQSVSAGTSASREFKVILLGGSGGASSAMAYACVHPEHIDGIIAMGTCDIISRLQFASQSRAPVLQKLAKTVFAAYGGNQEEKPELYRARSVLANADKLTMPVILAIGEKDALIPVTETRKIALALQSNPAFTYIEIPGGNHDSALWIDIDLETLAVKTKYH